MIQEADRAATLALNGLDSAFTDAVMPVLSNKLAWIPFYLLLLWFLWRRLGWKQTLLVLLAVLLAVAVTDQVANLVKNVVRRLRPCWDAYMLGNGLKVLEKKGGKFGFFSAHAATCAAVATTVLFGFRKWSGKRGERRLLAAILISWAVLVSISRIWVGKHFLGDVLVGAAAGVIIAWLLSFVSYWAFNKYFAKFVD